MGYWEKVKAALGNLSKKIKILIAVVLAVLVVLAIAAAVYFNTRPYSILIDGATGEETATVTAWLEAQGVTNYRVEGTGAVLVPEAQATSLKAKLLQEQYSSPSSPYSGYFERVSALSTMKDRDVALLDALTAKIESVIRHFPGVRDASVNIQTGEDRSYILDTNNVVNATAGVLLTMQDDTLLTAEQANAIRNYIAHSVPNLAVENVSIEDTNGNIYDMVGVEGGNASDDTALKLQTEQYLSNQYRSRLEKLLEGRFGKDHFDVSVNVTTELGDKTVNDYDVRLPEFAQDGSTNGAGILANQYYAYELLNGDEATVGGVVGTATNAEIPDYVEAGEPQDTLEGILKGEGSREYDNPKTQTYMVIHCVTLKDIYVGVSVDTTTSGPVDAEELRSFVASSLGIIPDLDITELTAEQYEIQKREYLSQKVGVLTGPWYQEPETPAPPTFLETLESVGIAPWVFFAAIGGLALFIIILVTVILLVRRSKKKKQAAEQKAVEEMMAAAVPGQSTVIIGADGQPVTVVIGEDGQPVEVPVPLDEDGNPMSGADVMDLHTERSMELRQSIRDFVDENMEVAALLIKSWMKEDGDNG